MQVRESDNQYFGFQDLIGDAIRKAASLASAAVLGERMPRLWKLLDSFQGTEHFKQKLIAQTLRLGVVILDRLVKLLLRDVKKSDFHLLAVFCEHICQ